MAKYQLFILMLAASAVFASPLSPEVEKSLARFKARATDRDDWKNYNQICGHKLDDTNRQAAADIWRKTGADFYLDLWTLNDNQQNWVRKLDQGVFRKSQSDSWDCATIGGTCGHAADCREFFNRQRPEAYWIMSAVSKAHSVFEYLHTQLTDNVLLNSLSLNELISDFGAKSPNINPYGAASGSFGAASGALGAATAAGGAAARFAGPVGGAIGAISGGLGIAAASFKPSDPHAALETMLGQYYNHSKTALEETMRNLFGEGDPEKLPAAGQTGSPDVLRSAIARFFNDGKFVIESVDRVWGNWVNEGNSMLRRALGIRILSSMGYLIWINPWFKSEKQCLQGFHGKSKMWLNDNCWSMVRIEKARQPGFDGHIHIELPDKIWDTMTEKYKMEMKWIYLNSMECKRARGDGDREVVAKNIPYTEQWAECLFNMDVVKGDFDAAKGWFKNFGPL